MCTCVHTKQNTEKDGKAARIVRKQYRRTAALWVCPKKLSQEHPRFFIEANQKSNYFNAKYMN